MGVFEGKSPAERNKLIAAIVLGVLAVISLVYTFGGSFIGGRSKTPVTADANASPTASGSPDGSPGTTTAQNPVSVPNEELINSEYLTQEITFNGVIDSGPIGGRNIFAFYEPPPPTPQPSFTPTPPKTPVFSPPPPATPFPFNISFINPQSRYAGTDAFQLQVNGDKFTPESKILFNGTTLQTTFVSPQRLTATVPAALINSAGFGQVRVDAFDGKNFSDQVAFNIQAPPKPTVEYIGMIARKHFNNDTAYFQKRGEEEPIGKRLNDVVDSRFRVVSISEKEVELEDTRLGFRHKLAMKRPDLDSGASDSFESSNPGNDRGRINNLPPNSTTTNTNCVPGIPCNIPRATPRRRVTTTDPTRKIPNPNQKDPDNDNY
jgi:hypothetical protein